MQFWTTPNPVHRQEGLPGRSDAGKEDLLQRSITQLHHHSIAVDNLHHLRGTRQSTSPFPVLYGSNNTRHAIITRRQITAHVSILRCIIETVTCSSVRVEMH